ncbi:MAG: YibE/F family protein [Clostridia bacterium]|nr:YibE/F family protein [Clostridia bacterium]
MKKDRLIYIASVVVCVALLVLGYFAVSFSDDFYASDDGTLYIRADVEQIIESSFSDSGEGDTVFWARISSGEKKGELVRVYQNRSDYTVFNPREVQEGDSIIIALFEGVENWHFIDFVRSDAIVVLLLVFALLLIVFGRKKGLKTVLSLFLTIASVLFVFIPAVLGGGNIYFWAVTICIYIIFMTLLITDGLSPMSLAAAIGCTGGVFASLIVTFFADLSLKLTGNAEPNSVYLISIGNGLDLKALIYASIIIGSVGAVMDVAVDISASLKELAIKLKNPGMRELFSSGINIGRDVIGTMSNTLVLAYIGGSLGSLLLYSYNNWKSPIYLFNVEIIIVEILKIIVGSIGILLTLPLTALVSSFIYTRRGMKKRFLTENVDAANEDEYSILLENAGTFEAENKDI